LSFVVNSRPLVLIAQKLRDEIAKALADTGAVKILGSGGTR